MLPRKKIQILRSSNCWECIEIVNFTITLLFPSGGPFWLLGGGVRTYPAHPLRLTGLNVDIFKVDESS